MVVIDLPRAEAVALVRGLRQNEVTRPTRDRLAQPHRPARGRDRAGRRGRERRDPAPRRPLPLGPAARGAPERSRPADRALPGAAARLVALRQRRRRGRGLGRQHRGARRPPREPARAGARDEGGADLRPPGRGLRRSPWSARSRGWPGKRAGCSAWASSSSSTAATRASGSPRSWRPSPSPTAPAPRPPSSPSPCARSRRRASGRRSCGRARSARRSSSTPRSTAS